MQDDYMIRDLLVDDYAYWRPLWDGHCAFYQVDLQTPVHGRVIVGDGGLFGFAHHVVHPTTSTATNADNAPARRLYDRYVQADSFVRYRIPLA
jgi:hypothetical protein